jgi:phosphoserine phosphatase RsbU/P
MATTTNPSPAAGAPAKIRFPARLRNFWQQITEGFELDQLWGQFKAEARESYGLYSRDVDWDQLQKEPKRWKRLVLTAWALFQAMLMKLTPARRVLLLLAILLLILQPDVHSQNYTFSFDLGGVGVLILFLLLAFELADRVTMKRDLEIAREIQQWLVPERGPVVTGIDIAFTTRPQNTVGGDYYDAFLRPLENSVTGVRPLLIAMADVAGKSVPAALLMATFQASLQALSSTPAPLEEIVTGLDRYGRAHSLEGRRFTTAFLGEINPETREMRYVNAGHNDPVLRRTSGYIERLSVGGPPLGLPQLSDSEKAYAVGQVQLNPGDLLLVFTDGAIEAVNEAGAEFGEARLAAAIQSAAPEAAAETLERVLTDVNAFAGQARQHDDITLMVIRIAAE